MGFKCYKHITTHPPNEKMKRNHKVIVYFSKEEKEDLEREADKETLKLSSYLRFLIAKRNRTTKIRIPMNDYEEDTE